MADGIKQNLGLGTVPEAPTSDPRKFKSTLAFKGVVTLTVMVVYFVLISTIIAYERNSLIDSVQLLNEIHKREEHVVTLNIMVARAILTVNENYFSPNVGISSKILVLEIEGVLTGLKKLGQHYSTIAEDAALLSKSMAELHENPKLAVVADIRGIFHRIVVDLDVIASDIRSRKQWLLEDYEHTHNRLTIDWIVFVVVGLGCLSGLMIWFFRRLAADIQRAQERATEIVRGYRGAPLPVRRRDELGNLISAVNNMQEELRKRETQLEISRQQQFHKEKMAAIGSLSASVAHEINNPLSAIIGIAQSMVDTQQCDCAKPGAPCQPQLVIEQAKRVMQITRQLGQISIPQSQNPELIGINGLVRSTCNFISFDRRLRRLELVQNLDPDLPAVYAVADHVVQVLMNLLINAADALENCADSPPRIAITTELRDGAVRIAISDNGCGIAPENLDKVFIEHFTTKAPGRGYGLGLGLCRSLILNAGGNLTIDSRVGEGTTVAITLPLPLRVDPDEPGNGRESQCMS